MGVEGGARTAREDVVGALLRFVRADKAGSVPHPTSLSALPLLFIEEKGRQKTRSGKQAFFVGRGLITLLKQLFSYNIIVYPIIRRFSHFFFSMKRKPALKKSRKGERARFIRSDEPEQSSDGELYGESKEVVHSLLPCCGARNSLLAIRSQNFDRCHSPVAAASAPGGAAAGSPSTPIGFARQPS